jgi:hypothetical protein
MNRLVVGVVVGAIAASVAAGWTVAAQPQPKAVVGQDAIARALRGLGQDVGRFQIVNGTPQFALNIMLRDTVTGDSWVHCSSSEVGDIWCKIPRSDDGTNPKKR